MSADKLLVDAAWLERVLGPEGSGKGMWWEICPNGHLFIETSDTSYRLSGRTRAQVLGLLQWLGTGGVDDVC